MFFCRFDGVVDIRLLLGRCYPCQADLHILAFDPFHNLRTAAPHALALAVCVHGSDCDFIAFSLFHLNGYRRKVFSCFRRDDAAVILCSLVGACSGRSSELIFNRLAVFVRFIRHFGNCHRRPCAHALENKLVFAVFRGFYKRRPGISRVGRIVKCISVFTVYIGLCACVEIYHAVCRTVFADFMSIHCFFRNAVADKLALDYAACIFGLPCAVGTDCAVLVSFERGIQTAVWNDGSDHIVVNLSFYLVLAQYIAKRFIRACHGADGSIGAFSADARYQCHTV